MYVDQSTQIQNYSNLVFNLSKQSRMADKKTAVPNKYLYLNLQIVMHDGIKLSENIIIKNEWRPLRKKDVQS